MKKVLTIVKSELYHILNGKRREGNCSGLLGDCTGLSGDCTGLRGDCSGIYGDCSGLRGDCSGIYGDLDEAKIKDKEREKGIDIAKLVKR